RCLDSGTSTGGAAPVVVQLPCAAAGPPQGRFVVQALDSGGYRLMTAAPPHCATATAPDRPVGLEPCVDGRADQLFAITPVTAFRYRIRAPAGCLEIVSGVAEVQARACGNSQAQWFAFTPTA
ncbi:MAG TPA: hypothetical protein VF062_27950, partial [Candidatus Limnocylindrales bacterium]